MSLGFGAIATISEVSLVLFSPLKLGACTRVLLLAYSSLVVLVSGRHYLYLGSIWEVHNDTTAIPDY